MVGTSGPREPERMKPNRKPEVIELDAEQLEAQLDQIEQTMGEQAARPFRQLLAWYLALLNLIEKKNTTIGRLRRLLFGARTERSCDLQPNWPDSTAHATDRTTGDGSVIGPSASPTDDG